MIWNFAIDSTTEPEREIGSVYEPKNAVLVLLELVVCSQLMLLYCDFTACGNSDSSGTSSESQYSRRSGADPRFVFSFDGSGWLYLYHYGVAAYVYDNFGGDIPGEIGFSGASGGALTACTLAVGVNPHSVADWAIERSPLA